MKAATVVPYLELATQWRPISMECNYIPLVGPGEGKGVVSLTAYPDKALKPSATSAAMTVHGSTPKAVHIKQTRQTGGFDSEWLGRDEDAPGGYMIYLSTKSEADVGYIKVKLTMRMRGSA